MQQTQTTQHTPGPWEYEPSPGSGMIWGRELHETLAVCDPHPTLGTKRHDGQEANARLIAAAPDLLAACKDFCAAFARGEFDDPYKVIPYTKAMSDAIIKAEGKS